MSGTNPTDREALVEQISTTEARLKELRGIRDQQIIDAHQHGVSKYRLAKDWAVHENTITRIVTTQRTSTTA